MESTIKGRIWWGEQGYPQDIEAPCGQIQPESGFEAIFVKLTVTVGRGAHGGPDAKAARSSPTEIAAPRGLSPWLRRGIVGANRAGPLPMNLPGSARCDVIRDYFPVHMRSICRFTAI